MAVLVLQNEKNMIFSKMGIKISIKIGDDDVVFIDWITSC